MHLYESPYFGDSFGDWTRNKQAIGDSSETDHGVGDLRFARNGIFPAIAQGGTLVTEYSGRGIINIAEHISEHIAAHDAERSTRRKAHCTPAGMPSITTAKATTSSAKLRLHTLLSRPRGRAFVDQGTGLYHRLRGSGNAAPAAGTSLRRLGGQVGRPLAFPGQKCGLQAHSAACWCIHDITMT